MSVVRLSSHTVAVRSCAAGSTPAFGLLSWRRSRTSALLQRRQFVRQPGGEPIARRPEEMHRVEEVLVGEAIAGRGGGEEFDAAVRFRPEEVPPLLLQFLQSRIGVDALLILPRPSRSRRRHRRSSLRAGAAKTFR